MIFIAGNSHTAAIRRGTMLSDKQADVRMFSFGSAKLESSSFSSLKDGRIHFDSQSVSSRVLDATGSETIGSNHNWGFVLGTHNSPLYGHEYWKFAEPHSIAGPNVRPISTSAMNEVVSTFLTSKLEFFEQLKSLGTKYFVISGPPPKLDNPCFRKGIRTQSAMYIDDLLRKMLSEWLGDNDIVFIEPPEDAVRNDGFLKDRYSQNTTANGTPDPHHANSEYGMLMYEKICAHVDKISC